MPDKERYIDAYKKFKELYEISSDNSNYNIRKEYLEFSVFIQSLFISKDGYIMGTGNFQTANYVMMDMIKKKVERHPLLWKLFFMIA